MARSATRRSEGAPKRRARAAGSHDLETVRLKLALAQMSTRLRKARRSFRDLTGFTAVTSLASDFRGLGKGGPLSPPVHPRCADRLRTVREAPCDEQWHEHVRTSLRSRRSHSHVCPLGLRCSCVPIYLGGTFVGVAKLVVDSGTPVFDVSAATATLSTLVSLSCHEAYVSVMRDEIDATRQRARGARRVEPAGGPGARTPTTGDKGDQDPGSAIVDRALDYLREHYHEHDLSLREVASAVGCNGKYLTHLFTQVVGQRMHGYVVGLRVERASRTLLKTKSPIKRVAIDAGFRDAGQLVRAFRQHAGVTPGAYRNIFSGR